MKYYLNVFLNKLYYNFFVHYNDDLYQEFFESENFNMNLDIEKTHFENVKVIEQNE